MYGSTTDVFHAIWLHLLAHYTHSYEKSVTSSITQRFANGEREQIDLHFAFSTR